MHDGLLLGGFITGQDTALWTAKAYMSVKNTQFLSRINIQDRILVSVL